MVATRARSGARACRRWTRQSRSRRVRAGWARGQGTGQRQLTPAWPVVSDLAGGVGWVVRDWGGGSASSGPAGAGVDAAERSAVSGGKTAREVAEQLKLIS